MKLYSRGIISRESFGVCIVERLDGALYTKESIIEIESKRRKELRKIAEDLLAIEFADDDEYTFGEIIQMMSDVAIALDRGLKGILYDKLWESSNFDDQIDCAYGLCKELLKKIDHEELPQQYIWFAVR